MNTKQNIKFELEGRFRFVAIRPDGSERVLSDWSKNLILDGGLNRLGQGGAWDRCYVGSGNTAPAVGQTALSAQVAFSDNVIVQTGGTDSPTNTHAWARRTYRFTAGQAEGNLSEVGVGWSGGLFARTLIKDELGDPTTITVLDDEILDVIYEVRAYPVLTDQVAVVTISGVDYEFTIRPAYLSGSPLIGGWPYSLVNLMGSGFITANAVTMNATAIGADAALAAITAASISGTPVASSPTPSFRSAYSNNSYQRQCRLTFSISQGTVPFGGFMLYTNVGIYQMTVEPTIPKDGSKTFALDFSVSWARR